MFKQDLNDRVSEAASDTLGWFPHLADDLNHSILSMMGEAGEVAGAYKKWHRSHLSELSVKDREIIGDEVVDVLVYAFVIAGQLGIDLEQQYDRKREFNDARFGRRTGSTSQGS